MHRYMDGRCSRFRSFCKTTRQLYVIISLLRCQSNAQTRLDVCVMVFIQCASNKAVINEIIGKWTQWRKVYNILSRVNDYISYTFRLTLWVPYSSLLSVEISTLFHWFSFSFWNRPILNHKQRIHSNLLCRWFERFQIFPSFPIQNR